jgi:hypothetical protein
VGQAFLPAVGFPAGCTRWKASPQPERLPHHKHLALSTTNRDRRLALARTFIDNDLKSFPVYLGRRW